MEGTPETLTIELDGEDLSLVGNLPEQKPEWTRLTFHQCPNCPLNQDSHPYCPLALNLVNVIQLFENVLSFHELHLEVITGDRHISQNTTAQRALSSLMGLLSAVSGCPLTAFFKPMARFHLPLASRIDTVYRAASMYLLAQYFRLRKGYPADLDLQGLEKIYEDVETVNMFLARRLRAASETDSPVNAVVILDTFAKALPRAIDNSLEEVRSLFTAYFD